MVSSCVDRAVRHSYWAATVHSPPISTKSLSTVRSRSTSPCQAALLPSVCLCPRGALHTILQPGRGSPNSAPLTLPATFVHVHQCLAVVASLGSSGAPGFRLRARQAMVGGSSVLAELEELRSLLDSSGSPGLHAHYNAAATAPPHGAFRRPAASSLVGSTPAPYNQAINVAEVRGCASTCQRWTRF
jgi:hypothetical protein